MFTIVTGKERKWAFDYTCYSGESTRTLRPAIRGTLKSISSKLEHDRNLQSMESGGTYLVKQWFFDNRPVKQTTANRDAINSLIWGHAVAAKIELED